MGGNLALEGCAPVATSGKRSTGGGASSPLVSQPTAECFAETKTKRFPGRAALDVDVPHINDSGCLVAYWTTRTVPQWGLQYDTCLDQRGKGCAFTLR
jgi:hypothetical protein